MKLVCGWNVTHSLSVTPCVQLIEQYSFTCVEGGKTRVVGIQFRFLRFYLVAEF